MVRIRVRYMRSEGLRYIGNLDMHKVWERLLRRAQLPVAYSQGFHPQPKIQQASPLPLGFLGEDEIIDIWLDQEQVDLQAITKAFSAAEQPGILVHEVLHVPTNEPAMMTQIREAEYKAIYFDTADPDWVSSQVDHLLSLTTLPREKRGKKYDLRPLIISLRLNSTDPIEFEMILSSKEGATGRPEEVLAEIGLDPHAARYIRTRLIAN
jgi:radical SAM-linked protein